MRSITLVVFLLSLASVAAFGQSGRRVQATPTPVPATREAEFSESKPKPRRPVWISPTDRLRQNQTASTTPAKPIADTTADSDEEVKVETTLVTIPVSVFDRNGLYISGLNQNDFNVFEDGKEQEIAYFGTSDKPFTVILLIDTSPSTEYKIDEIRAAAVAFVDQLKAQDRVMVIEFDANVHVLTEATSDRQLIYKGIRKADFGGGTSLYEAVDFSLKKRLNAIEGRKAIVLFTDGVDTTSRGRTTYDSTLALAEESDALIFPIYYNTYFDNRIGTGGGGGWPGTIVFGPPPRGNSAEDYALGRRYLEELADYTGGRVFRPESTPGGLTAAFEGIAEELRRQYQIGYTPADDGKPGQRKQIKVRVNRPNLVIRSRDSYIVGETPKASVPAKPAA
ncbi:MAG: VWA domain-containing protein [bacterium]|nr:VWA domain-containing protein [bacterium]